MAVMDFLKQEIDQLKSENRHNVPKVLSSQQSAEAIINGKKVINLSANNYLGLANHPKIGEAAKKAIDKWGFGAGAVRPINGTMEIHLELERKLAEFKHCESSLVFVAGIAANRGTIQALLTSENDVAISDELNHASIIDGVRLSKAQRKIFPHKDMAGLEKALQECKGMRRVMVITDGVFSMDGDIAPLDKIVALAEKYGAFVMVDDAHGEGVLGHQGRGIVDHFKLHGRVQIDMGTLSKAIGVLGGYIAGQKELTDFLINTARPFLFSTAHPPAVAAATMAALEVMQTENWRHEKLWENARYFKKGLGDIGYDTGVSETPINPVIAGDEGKTQQLARKLWDEGVFCQPIVFPTVARGKARVRTIVTSIHTKEQLDLCLDKFKKVGKELGLI
jgi:glycine C-acetyltransferase